jgi:hypothetical protein
MAEDSEFETSLTDYSLKDLYDTLILTTKTIAHYAKSLKEDSIPEPAAAAFFLSLDENLKDMWAVRHELVRRRRQNLNGRAASDTKSPTTESNGHSDILQSGAAAGQDDNKPDAGRGGGVSDAV